MSTTALEKDAGASGGFSMSNGFSLNIETDCSRAGLTITVNRRGI